MTMRYRNELCVEFPPSAFSAKKSKGGRRSSRTSRDVPMSLSFSPESSRGLKRAVGPTPEKALLLHAMRMRLPQLPQGSTHPRTFLASISKTWDIAYALKKEIQVLEFCGVTRCKTVGTDHSEPTLLKVRCILLGQRPSAAAGTEKTEARLDVDFTVKPRPAGNADALPSVEADIDVDVSVSKVYGFSNGGPQAPEAKICDFLNKMIQPNGDGRGNPVQFGDGLWRGAVKELEKKLFSR